MSEEVREIIYGKKTDDEKAVQEILEAKIPCKLIGPVEDGETPRLISDSVNFWGLEGIREFIKGWNHVGSGKEK